MATDTTPLAFAEEGRRDTRQRRLLREHLAQSDAFASAQQVYDDLRTEGNRVGLATIYRTLQAMAEAGEVDTLRTETGEVLYRKCDPAHHHHLMCRNCGLTVEIEGPSVERWAERAAAEHGFTGVKHVIELFGTCRACSTA